MTQGAPAALRSNLKSFFGLAFFRRLSRALPKVTAYLAIARSCRRANAMDLRKTP
jgi:hypothetical protein